jgi:hypothetical protein
VYSAITASAAARSLVSATSKSTPRPTAKDNRASRSACCWSVTRANPSAKPVTQVSVSTCASRSAYGLPYIAWADSS